MAALSVRDYQSIVDLTAAILDSASTSLPWKLLREELSRAVPNAYATLIWTQGWVDAPPENFPMPYSSAVAHVLTSFAEECLHQHPLVLHYQSTASQTPRTATDLPRGQRWQDEQVQFEVERLLNANQHLALPLPAPSGQAHLVVLGRTASEFSQRDREFVRQLQPLLAGVVNQQRQLLRWRLAADTTADATSEDLSTECGLTPRELTVLTLLGDTLTAEAIAHRLRISPRTVHRHLGNIYRKLGTRDRLDTVLRARQAGLLRR